MIMRLYFAKCVIVLVLIYFKDYRGQRTPDFFLYSSYSVGSTATIKMNLFQKKCIGIFTVKPFFSKRVHHLLSQILVFGLLPSKLNKYQQNWSLYCRGNTKDAYRCIYTPFNAGTQNALTCSYKFINNVFIFEVEIRCLKLYLKDEITLNVKLKSPAGGVATTSESLRLNRII